MSIARALWPRLLSLVEQALDLPATEREPWLHQLDLSDELKLALRGLLDERRAIETGDFLGALPAIAPAAAVAGRLLPGTLIGPWRLLREIGQGGMSTVWLAERADDQLQRQVALKLPHAGPGQDLLAARLLRERNILAALEHRNIARLYDVGLSDAGTPYLVMEYVAGDTLLAHADRLKLGIPQRLALFQQVLRAVQYAHGKLVLHRDLKPGNILVNETGDVKLLDFGIAKLLAAEGHLHDETELTRSAGRQLTPAYASPEQLQGEALGTASDVYSLGVLLHELLSGQRPFAELKGSALQMHEAVLYRAAKAPSRLNVDADALAARGCTAPQWQKTLHGDLDAIVLRTLAKTPAERYGSVDPLAADVAHWLAHEPVSVTAPSRWYHLRKFVLRHRLGVGLGSAVAALLLLTSTVAVWQGLRAAEEARRASASRDFLLGIFEDTDPEATTGRDLSAKEILARSRTKLLAPGQHSQVLPVPDLLTGIAGAQTRLGDPLGAVATLDRLLERLPATDAAARPHRVDVLLSLANETLNLNQLDEARRHLRAAIEALGPPQDASRAQLRRLAYVAGLVAVYDRQRAATARQALQAYFDLADTPDSDEPSSWLQARLNLAQAESLLGHQAQAQAHLQLASALAQAEADRLPAGAAFRPTATYRANLDRDWGQYAQVLSWLGPVIERCGSTLGPANESCLDLSAHAIRAQLKVGRQAEAAALAPTLQVQADNAASPSRQLLATVTMLRAFDFAGATAAGQRSQQQLSDLLQGAAPSRLSPRLRLLGMNTLAEVHLARGDLPGAWAWTQGARALQADAALPAADSEVAKTALFEGIVLQAQGQHAAALQRLAPFCDEPRLAVARQSAVLARLFSLNCVASLRALGEPERAKRLVEQALPVLQPALGESSPTLARIRTLLASPGGAGPPAAPARSPARPASPRPTINFFS